MKTLLLLLVVLAYGLSGHTYHVAKTGSNSNPGTEVSPWLTIGKGCSTMVSLDTLIVHGNTEAEPEYYNQRISYMKSGDTTDKQNIKRTLIMASPRRSVLMKGFQSTTAYAMEIRSFYIKYTTYDMNLGGGICFKSGGGYYSKFYDNRIDSANGRFGIQMRARCIATKNYLYRCQYGMYLERSCVADSNEIEELIQYTAGEDCDYFRAFVDSVVIRANYCHGSTSAGMGTAHSDFVQQFYFLGNGYWLSNLLVEGNIVLGPFIGQAIMVQDDQDLSYNITIRNNVFASVHETAINIDVNTTGVKIYNNTISGPYYAIRAKSGSEIIAKNNIFVNTTVRAILNEGGTVDHSNNLYYNYVNTGSDTDETDIKMISPLFADTINGDWSITVNSPARDSGCTIADVVNDLLNVSRPVGPAYDIGAYEYETGDPSTKIGTLEIVR